jgi:parallel beta-helix repeat protein
VKGTDQQAVIPAAIHLQNAENVRFVHNTFRNLGGAGVTLWAGVNDTVVDGNTFQDIAAGGISIAMDLMKKPSEPQICRRNLITNNFITRVGRDYHSSVGVFAGYTQRLVIEHNELTDLPYTGISVGWGWTTENTALKNNLIRRNRIHHVMTQLSDGGGIYTLSKQPGTNIIENHIFHIIRSPWAGEFSIAGIYLDAGSSLITVEDNVLENVPLGIFLNEAQNNTIINNRNSFEERAAHGNNFVDHGNMDSATITANAGTNRDSVSAAPPEESLYRR